MMYDPDVIVINSPLYRKVPEMIDRLKEELKNRFTKEIVVRNTHLKEQGTLYGALGITAQKFLNIRQLKWNSVE